MEAHPSSKLRAEVQLYLRVCQEMLAAGSSDRPFTIEEMAIIKYCEAEVAKLSAPSPVK